MATSPAISARASRVSPLRTFWIIERSATMAPTPIATQTKKNSSRRQDARISAAAPSRQDECHETRAARSTWLTTRPSRRAIVTSAMLRELRIVRDEHDRRAAPAIDVDQEVDDLVAGAGVEIAGRLVGEQDRRLVGQRPRDRHALLLAAGELRRIVMAPRPPGRPRRAARPRGAPASGAPAISSGTRTFSHAVSDGSRWKNWKTKPMRVAAKPRERRPPTSR